MTARGGRAPLTLEARLAAGADLTPAGRRVAGWLAAHPRRLPFATDADIAAAVGVSEMTVLRCVRALGYSNLRALKAELMARRAEVAGPLDDRWQRFRVARGSDAATAESLRREIAALVQVYEMAATPVREAALDALMAARQVHLTGFQASEGLALDFATRLEDARPGVRFAEGTSGTDFEILAEDEPGSSVLMVDTAASSTTGFRLAAACQAQGVPLVVVTDRFGDWARAHAPGAGGGHADRHVLGQRPRASRRSRTSCSTRSRCAWAPRPGGASRASARWASTSRRSATSPRARPRAERGPWNDPRARRPEAPRPRAGPALSRRDRRVERDHRRVRRRRGPDHRDRGRRPARARLHGRHGDPAQGARARAGARLGRGPRSQLATGSSPARTGSRTAATSPGRCC